MSRNLLTRIKRFVTEIPELEEIFEIDNTKTKFYPLKSAVLINSFTRTLSILGFRYLEKGLKFN